MSELGIVPNSVATFFLTNRRHKTNGNGFNNYLIFFINFLNLIIRGEGTE